jgi:hypothetical protein
MHKHIFFYMTLLLALTLIISNRTSSILAQGAGSKQARFIDNNDGTVTDRQSKLMWEKKQDLGWPGHPPLDEVHAVDDRYTWGGDAYGRDCSWCWFGRPFGNLFSDFLTRLNRADDFSKDGGSTIIRRTYGDWRIPNIVELKGIQDCSKPNCLDPIFGLVVGPGRTSAYFWSSTIDASSQGAPDHVLVINSADGQVYSALQTDTLYVRAVRGPIQVDSK